MVGLGFLALAAFTLRDVLFFGEAFFERDLAWLYFPQVEAFVRALAEGALPLRDPTIGFGQPLLASPDTQILYPLGWLHLIFLPDQAYSLMVLAHFLIGASGAAALAFLISRSWGSAFFAGALWIVSGPFLSALNLWHHFAGTAWMPWVLAGFERLLGNPTPRRVLVLGGLFGMQILAGSADLCAMTVLLALLRLLCEGRGFTVLLSRRLGGALGAAVIALAIGAGVWLPALEVVRGAGRNALSHESRTDWSVHPVVATELVAPIQIGALPLSPEQTRRLTDSRPPLLKSLFLGALILPLLVAGLVNRDVPRKHRLFLGLGIALTLLAALGRYTPAYDLMVTVVPPLTLFRYPVKVALPLSLLACVLASLGVHALERRRDRLLVGGISALLALSQAGLFANAQAFFSPFLDGPGTAEAGAVIAKTATGLLLVAMVLGGFAVVALRGRGMPIRAFAALGIVVTLFINREINFTISHEVMRFRPAHAALFKDAEPSRLYTFPYLYYPELLPEILAPRSPIPPETFILLIRSALMAPIGGLWNIEYAWDYDQKALLDQTLSQLTTFVNRPDQKIGAVVRLLQIAGVKRVADFDPSRWRGLSLTGTIQLPGSRPLQVFEVPNPRPRVYAVSGARRLTLAESQVVILDPRFDAAAEVAITEGMAAPISSSFRSTVKIVERRSDRVVIDATLNEPGHVVLLEGFLPGWQATVDGAPVPVRRANALFVSTEVTTGEHRVVFTYRPLSALLGIALTALSALAWLAALVHLRSRPEP